MYSESWLLVVEVTWVVGIINTYVRSCGPGPTSELWQGLPGPGGGSRELSQGRQGPVGNLGVWGGGLGPKASHQEHGKIRSRFGKTTPTAILWSPCLLSYFLHFPIHPLLEWSFKIAVPMCLVPSLKALDNLSAHREKTNTIRLIFTALQELATACRNLAFNSAPHLAPWAKPVPKHTSSFLVFIKNNCWPFLYMSKSCPVSQN